MRRLIVALLAVIFVISTAAMVSAKCGGAGCGATGGCSADKPAGGGCQADPNSK